MLASRSSETPCALAGPDFSAGPATLGSCNRGLSARALRDLLGCPRRLLVAYDVDAEGDKGAERLGQVSPRMQRIRPPVGTDVTAFWQADGQVRAWVSVELARLRREAGVLVR